MKLPAGQGPEALSVAFRNAFRSHPAGVAIVTADPGSGPVALTVSSLISVNAEPPTVAFSVSGRSGSGAALMSASTIVVHLLQFSNLELVRKVAAPGADRFGPDTDWERLATGEPRYREVRTLVPRPRAGPLSARGRDPSCRRTSGRCCPRRGAGDGGGNAGLHGQALAPASDGPRSTDDRRRGSRTRLVLKAVNQSAEEDPAARSRRAAGTRKRAHAGPHS